MTWELNNIISIQDYEKNYVPYLQIAKKAGYIKEFYAKGNQLSGDPFSIFIKSSYGYPHTRRE